MAGADLGKKVTHTELYRYSNVPFYIFNNLFYTFCRFRRPQVFLGPGHDAYNAYLIMRP